MLFEELVRRELVLRRLFWERLLLCDRLPLELFLVIVFPLYVLVTGAG